MTAARLRHDRARDRRPGIPADERGREEQRDEVRQERASPVHDERDAHAEAHRRRRAEGDPRAAGEDEDDEKVGARAGDERSHGERFRHRKRSARHFPTGDDAPHERARTSREMRSRRSGGIVAAIVVAAASVLGGLGWVVFQGLR